MLRLNGNSEYAFATRNSINANPIVYVEWNYNSIARPYVVAPNSYGVLDEYLKNADAWKSSSGTAHRAKYSGYATHSNPSPEAIALTVTGTNNATFRSSSVTLESSSAAKYYKLTFYAKADQPINATPIKTIPYSEIDAETSAAGDTYYFYRIVQVDKNGNSAAIDYDYSDVKAVDSSTAANNIKLHWDHETYAGPVYHIYRGRDYGNMSHLRTVNAKKYKVDNFDNSASITTTVIEIEGPADDLFLGARVKMLSVKNLSNIVSPSDKTKRKSLSDYQKDIEGTLWKILSKTSSTDNTTITASYIGTEKLSSAGVKLSASKTAQARLSLQSFIDLDINSTSTRLDPIPLKSDRVRLMPTPILKYQENTIDSTKYFIRTYETETSHPQIKHGVIELDPINYTKIEVFFEATERFDSVEFDLDINASYYGPSVLLYNPEIYEIDDWNFISCEYYPIESVFDSNRPGEALLNPYLQYDDTQINSTITNARAIKTKPASFAVFNPNDLFGNLFPYKQVYDSYLNNTMRYYVSNWMSSVQNRTSTSIMANYHDPMSINKVVVKGSNCFSNLAGASGSVTLITADGSEAVPFESGDFNDSGIMILHWNGLEWSSTRPTDGTFPPTLTDSGILQNVKSDITGIIFTIDNLPIVKKGDNKTLRAHIIEISPRLELDISGITKSFSVTKSMDDSSAAAGFPLSYINANSATIEIDNIPVYKNNFPYTIFDNFAEGATFYGLLKQNVKFNVALKSPNQDFTEAIPMFTMYADTWTISDIRNLTVSLYDATKSNLMALQAPDYLGEDESMFSTITNVMDAAGFSDYDYDSLKQIMNRRTSGTTHFWCDRTQTLFEAMQSFFVAHQIGAFFDEYGIMRFVDIDQILDNYLDRNIEPDFAVSDMSMEIKSGDNYITYIPNLVSQGYSTSVEKKIGKVALEYSIPIRNFSGDVNVDGFARAAEAPAMVWTEKEDVGIILSYAKRSVYSGDDAIFTDPLLSTLRKLGSSPANTVGSYNGTAFLQGELVSWSGQEWQFYPFTKSSSVSFSASAIVTSASPFKSSASIVTTSPSAAKVAVGMTAYGEQIPLDSTVKAKSSKVGSKKTFTASYDGERTSIVSSNPAASSVKVDWIVQGSYFPANTYVTSVEIASSSTVIALNNKPTKIGALNVSTYGSSTTFTLSASTTAVGTASTSGSTTNYSTSFDVGFSLDDSAKVANPEFSKGLRIIATEPNDIQSALRQIISQDERISGAKFDFTGKLHGLIRGDRFTSVRNHYMVDDDLKINGTLTSGWVSSSVCFNKRVINSRTTTLPLNGNTSDNGSTIVFDKNVAKFKVNRDGKNNSYPLLLSPKQSSDLADYNQPVTASSFNYYSFMFTTENFGARKQWGSDTSIVELGLYISTEEGNLMIGLTNDKDTTYLKSNVDRGTTGSGDNEDDLSVYVLKTTHDEGAVDAGDILWKKKVRNVFDGKSHRVGFAFHTSSDFSSAANFNFYYCTVIIDGASYGPYKINKYLTGKNIARPAKTWGFYVRNTDRNFNSSGKVKNSTVSLHEMYACKWWNNEMDEVVKNKRKWHWETKYFLDGLLNMKVDVEPKYYFWGKITLRGIKFYEGTNFETSPIKTETLHEEYDGYEPKTTVDQTFKTLTPTNKSHLVMSTINRTPFRFNFAVTHKKNELVWLSTSNNQVEGTEFTPMSFNANYNKTTDPIVLERVIDASSIANSIQLSTNWVQSDHDAKVLLNKIGLLANSFNNEVSVTIFGNPLIQTGDICQFAYSLKRLGYDPEDENVKPKMFLVKSVNHNYGAGLKTELVLKPLFDVPE